MPHRPAFIFVLLALAACRAGDEATPDAARDTLARATRAPAVAYRLPSGGGPVHVYELPALRQTPWGGGGRISAAREAVGSDIQGRRLLFRATGGALTSFDLVALRERSIAPGRFMAALAGDGTLLAIDSSGEVIESQPWGTRAWQARLGRGVRVAFAAPGARLIVLRRGTSDSLEIVAHEGTRISASAAPAASAQAATPAGDAVAFATAEGITVIETASDTARWSVPLTERAVAVAFSPSGHRIYAALRNRREIAVIDRFSRRRRGSIALPGPALALRPDPWGRVLLARGQGTMGDPEVWVISTGTEALLGRLASPWASDLPAVTESGLLLLREGTAVVARDARRLDSLGAAEGGAADLWFTGRWVAASATAAARAEQAERSSRGATGERPAGDSARPRGTGAPDAAAPARGGGAFWVQIASSRSEQAIRDLARELGAQVVPPRTDSDPWRVMAGPYGTRQAADSAGRALGRPYFITERPRSP